MDYKELQMGGDIIKPIKYHIGEWQALQYFSLGWKTNDRILDIGCGIGYGVGMLELLGFWDVMGIDINPDKITIGKRLGYEVYEQNLIDNTMANFFDVIWCSHTFEHMQDADKAIQRMLDITTKDACIYFILPYPDLTPAPAHCASSQIGLDVDDKGDSVVSWFESKGLHICNMRFSNFREPEIWLKVIKR